MADIRWRKHVRVDATKKEEAGKTRRMKGIDHAVTEEGQEVGEWVDAAVKLVTEATRAVRHYFLHSTLQGHWLRHHQLSWCMQSGIVQRDRRYVRFWRTNVWNEVSGRRTVCSPRTPAEVLFKRTVLGCSRWLCSGTVEEGWKLLPNTPENFESQRLSWARHHSALCGKIRTCGYGFCNLLSRQRFVNKRCPVEVFIQFIIYPYSDLKFAVTLNLCR